ncbi:hypothetical protein VTK56DRAFT_1159 [Thermocarpiscus australiensis]
MDPFFAPNHTISSYNALVKPLFDGVRELRIPFTPNTTYHDPFYAAYDATWGSNIRLNSAGRVSIPGNRQLPRGTWPGQSKFNTTFAVLRRHGEAGPHRMSYHQVPRNRASADNAVNSGPFRHTVCFLTVSGRLPAGMADPAPTQIRAALEELRDEIIAPLRAVALESEGGGAHLGEASVDEPEWQRAFYGVHCPRLLEIKRKYNPRQAFYATTAVGSEGWKVRDDDQGAQTQNGRLCRV